MDLQHNIDDFINEMTDKGVIEPRRNRYFYNEDRLKEEFLLWKRENHKFTLEDVINEINDQIDSMEFEFADD